MAKSNFSFVQLLQGTSWRLIGSPAIFRSRSTFQFWSENYLVASPLLLLSLWCSYEIQCMVKCNLLHNQMCCPAMIETKRPSKVLSPALHCICIYTVFLLYFSSLHCPLSSIFPPISHLQLFLPPVSQCNAMVPTVDKDLTKDILPVRNWAQRWLPPRRHGMPSCKHKDIEEIWVLIWQQWSEAKTKLNGFLRKRSAFVSTTWHHTIHLLCTVHECQVR